MVWNSANGAVLYELPVTEGDWIHSLAFSPSGEYLAVGGRDVLQVWNLTTKVVAFSEPLGGQHVTFDASGDWLIAGSRVAYLTNPVTSPDIRIWSVPRFRLVRSFATDTRGNGNRFARYFTVGGGFRGLAAGTHHIALCSKTQRLGVLSWDGSIRLLNLGVVIDLEERPQSSREPRADSRPEVVTLRGDLRDQASILAFDPAGKRLATVEMRGMLRIWDISHPQEAFDYGTVHVANHFLNVLFGNVLFGDSSTAIVYGTGGAYDYRIRTIDTINGVAFDYPERIESSENVVLSELSEDGRILAALIDRRLHVRSVHEQRDIMVVNDVSPVHCGIALDSGGRKLALWSNGHLRIWDIASGEPRCDITPASHGLGDDQNWTWKFTSDPAGERIAAFRPSGEDFAVWDARSAQLIAKVNVSNCRKVFLDDDRLITVHDDQLKCWSLPVEKQPSANSLEGNAFKPSWVYQSPDKFQALEIDRNIVMSGDFTRIAVRKDSETVIILDADTGRLIGEPIRSGGSFASPAFELSPDGSRLLGYKNDGQLHLHHIDGHRDILNLSVLGQSVTKMTSDGNKIVGVSPDGIVRVLDGTPWVE